MVNIKIFNLLYVGFLCETNFPQMV